MKAYKHYSFDLWLTLIRSNPVFKKERAIFFYKYLNASNKPIEEVERVFRHIDLMVNAINQKTGGNISAEDMYLMVVYELNQANTTFQDLDVSWLLDEMEQLFFQYSPLLYNPETLNTLKAIKALPDVSISILSNTGFIKGATLRVVLERLGLSPFFDFQLYSDEETLSKPNSKFFELMLDNIFAIKQNNSISVDEIIHVGDNPLADIHGANTIKINSLLINSNQQTIADLLK